jgi:hypothetical protein
MTAQKYTKKRRISEVLAVAAMMLLTLDTVNTFTSQRGYGFLYLTDQQSGIFLGLPSVVLFFASFGLGFRQETEITTSLLIAGGVLLAVCKIVEPTLGLNLFLVITLPYLYMSLITIGFLLIGLGLLRVVRRQNFLGPFNTKS